MANILWIDNAAGFNTVTNRSNQFVRKAFDDQIFFIEQNHHTVDIVNNSDEIVTSLNKIDEYDLVLLDVLMPGLPFYCNESNEFGGFDVLQYLHDLKKSIPIILFSVMSELMINKEAENRKISLKEYGVIQIVRKGTTPLDLYEIVRSALNSRGLDKNGSPD